ncbi:kinetochore protein fta4 [Purpureocillium lavendulum]|uniref:Kinetochore protein fta4 n=1 Tax=Purpureocillium lavendulum TaxID=1247861 RepID=A0AB34FXP2_9HYPO|nr:kinetochore protein fta4 [Purpureocillium lavendulum]
MSAAPTVPSLKQSFLAAQTTLLAQPLAPSAAWRSANDDASADVDKAPIPARALDDALVALNATLQQHARRVYPPQASRNVAAQIAAAYDRDAERRVSADAANDAEALGRELDLADEQVLEALPDAWPSERDTNAHPAEAKRYADTVAHLAELNARRKDLRQRVQRLRGLKSSIAPLDTADDGGARIQDNLIVRNGPVETELERMRVLLARVAGRVNELPAKGPATRGDGGKIDLDALDGARKRSVDEFLADSRVFPS